MVADTFVFFLSGSLFGAYNIGCTFPVSRLYVAETMCFSCLVDIILVVGGWVCTYLTSSVLVQWPSFTYIKSREIMKRKKNGAKEEEKLKVKIES